MSVRRLAEVQPDSFSFSAENAAWVDKQIAKYPPGRQASAVIPLLWMAQKQNGYWLSEPAIRVVAEKLGMAQIRVLEIATFYTMFNLEPVGQYYIQLCGTTPCWLRGADDLKAVCREVIGEQRHVTEDGMFSWLEVECLGACCNAPMVQINDDYHEDLTAESFRALLDDLRAGRAVKIGSQTGRTSSEPMGGATTLSDAELLKIIAARAKPGLILAEETAGEGGEQAPAEKPAPAPSPAPRSTKPKPAAVADVVESEPALFTEAPVEGADDLKLISGVGPKLEGVLNSMGIYRFDQIAGWTAENVAWVDARLTFKGRIERDSWIDQAKALTDRGAG